MAVSPAILVLGMVCAALIGFAAHRASLCNVRAVAEIMSHRTAHMLSSLLQAALWMALLSGSLVQIGGHAPPPVSMPVATAWAVAGGWLFGSGAALNGGCSLSTLHRLADGELGMLATLLGFALGVIVWASALSFTGAATLSPVASVWIRWPSMSPWLLGALLFWALARLATLRRLAKESPATRLGQRLLAPSYHLTASAALMGLAGGVLYATQGAWSYTNHLRTSVLHAWPGGQTPSAAHTALVAALVIGMLASAWQRRSLVWRRPPTWRAGIRHAGGGVLMGAGAAMVPGGNDTVLLNALPTLATQAVAAYLAMLAGIATVLWSMRRARMSMPSVDCTPAGCSETPAPPQR